MVSLNEHVRKSVSNVGSKDPLLSAFGFGYAGPKSHIQLVSGLIMNGSIIRVWKLRTPSSVQTDETVSLTPFMESWIDVLGRYDRKFTGTIMDNGTKFDNQEVFLLSTYANCKINLVPVVYNRRPRGNQKSSQPVDDPTITCITEREAFGTVFDLLRNGMYCLADVSFDPNKKDYPYSRASKILSVN